MLLRTEKEIIPCLPDMTDCPRPLCPGLFGREVFFVCTKWLGSNDHEFRDVDLDKLDPNSVITVQDPSNFDIAVIPAVQLVDFEPNSTIRTMPEHIVSIDDMTQNFTQVK